MKRNKDTVITFRCTQEEKKTILDQACASNLNMSNYIIRETVHKSKKSNVDNSAVIGLLERLDYLITRLDNSSLSTKKFISEIKREEKKIWEQIL